VAPAGSGGISGIARFGDDVGRPVTYGMAYLDARSTWSAFADPAWVLDPWTTWLRADPTRRLVLGVPMLQAGSAGRFDDASNDRYFVQLARSIERRGIGARVVIRLGYEMNEEWSSYGRQYDPDGSGFRSMWRRVVPQMKAVFPFLFDWCVTPTADRNEPGFPERFYPGDDVVDVVGLDFFDHWVSGSPDERWRQLAPKLDWAGEFATAHHKRLALDEWGLWSTSNAQGGGDDPTYVTATLRWAKDHDLAWASYFDAEEGQVDTTLQENPASLAAFRAIVTNP
jgi:hypothetical protein